MVSEKKQRKAKKKEYKRKDFWKTGSESKKNHVKEMGKGNAGDG